MRKVPEFKTEEEELSFWDKHDPEDFDAGPADDVILDVKPEKKKRISLRLEPGLIEELKAIAEANNMRYQTLVRGLLKRSVRQLRKTGTT